MNNNYVLFCPVIATYHNDAAKMSAYDECMLNIERKDINVINPNDQAVSLKLRDILCNWIDLHNWTSTQTDIYFNDYSIEFHHCYICNEQIEDNSKNDIAIPTGGNTVAHFTCSESIGFKGYFDIADYNEILGDLHLDEKINEL